MTTALAPITVTINRRSPTGNKSTFGHWRDYAKERDIWFTLIRAQLKPKEKPTHRVMVEITSFRVQNCDRINGAHGCKVVLDALVKLGYLYDDSEGWLDDTYVQVKAKRVEERTVVRIVNP